MRAKRRKREGKAYHLGGCVEERGFDLHSWAVLAKGSRSLRGHVGDEDADGEDDEGETDSEEEEGPRMKIPSKHSNYVSQERVNTRALGGMNSATVLCRKRENNTMRQIQSCVVQKGTRHHKREGNPETYLLLRTVRRISLSEIGVLNTVSSEEERGGRRVRHVGQF